MNNALRYRSNEFELIEGTSYATTDTFQNLFAREMNSFFHLSLLLTADAEKAESCLIHSMRECLSSATVSRQWARIWARRMVVRNAIHVVLGNKEGGADDICDETGLDFHLQPSEYRLDGLQESPAILSLPDFDRLVFVICALERYSVLDCALLLGRSPKDVQAAHVRATDQVLAGEKRTQRGTTTDQASSNGARSDGEVDDACGSTLF